MSLDARFVTSLDLSPFLVDRDTGAPLSGGTIEFWEDDNRTTPKLVYELTGAPPNYTYSPLPNPIVLSSVGTIQDSTGDDVALYYFPYASMETGADVQLYYVVVRNALGVLQFTREAWPNITAETNANATQDNISNALSNSQFVTVNFNPNTTFTYSFSGTGTSTVEIAPDWNLIVQYTGTGTVTVVRNYVVGSSDYPYNPPYTLTVTGGPNIASLQLSQRMTGNPNIWSPDANGTNGFIAASILLAPLSSITSMVYQPSTGTSTTLLSANNTTGVYTQFSATVKLPEPDNSDSSAVGFVDIIINLPVSSVTTLSNVQIVGLENNNSNVVYEQLPVNRQEDYLFHYYNPLLQYKQIPSYLIGWNFAQNPAQPLGTSPPASGAGANTSRYVWDQTIVFQSVNNGPAISKDASGALTLTATTASQVALIQYLSQHEARKILNDSISVNVAAITNVTGGLGAVISLWYTTDMSLPSTASNNSLVATLDSTGKPATLHGSWIEVPRANNLGNAAFTIEASPNTTNFNDYGFSGWNLDGIAACNTATFFAIVVGTQTLPLSHVVYFDSISLVAGDIPTRPAPQSSIQTLLDCQHYYAKSFAQGTIPAENVGVNTGEATYAALGTSGNPNLSGSILFPVAMHSIPTLVTYSPGNASAQVYNVDRSQALSATTTFNLSALGFGVVATGSSGTTLADQLGVHYTADARLGS